MRNAGKGFKEAVRIFQNREMRETNGQLLLLLLFFLG